MYCLIFGPLLFLSLAMVNYNIGLGQRMKMMAVPTVLLLCGIVYMYNRFKRRRLIVIPEPVSDSSQAATESAPARA